MNTTCELDDILAEIDNSAAPAVAKYDKKNPPSYRIIELEGDTKRFEPLKTQLKDIEAELAGIKADVVKAARPLQREASRKFRVHVPTIKINGLSVQCDPPHYTTKLVGADKIREAAGLFGDQFLSFFRVVRIIPETPEIVACLKAAGIKYCTHMAPLKALHEAASTDPAVDAKLIQIGEIRPIWKVLL